MWWTALFAIEVHDRSTGIINLFGGVMAAKYVHLVRKILIRKLYHFNSLPSTVNTRFWRQKSSPCVFWYQSSWWVSKRNYSIQAKLKIYQYLASCLPPRSSRDSLVTVSQVQRRKQKDKAEGVGPLWAKMRFNGYTAISTLLWTLQWLIILIP